MLEGKKGGELAMPERDSLGDQHRDIDRAIAKRTRSRFTRGGPLTREKIVAAGLDKIPSSPPGLKPEPAPIEPTEPPTIGEYINHKQD